MTEEKELKLCSQRIYLSSSCSFFFFAVFQLSVLCSIDLHIHIWGKKLLAPVNYLIILGETVGDTIHPHYFTLGGCHLKSFSFILATTFWSSVNLRHLWKWKVFCSFTCTHHLLYSVGCLDLLSVSVSVVLPGCILLTKNSWELG